VPYSRVNQSHDWVDGQMHRLRRQSSSPCWNATGHVKGSGTATSNDTAGSVLQRLLLCIWRARGCGSGRRCFGEHHPGLVITAEVVAMTGDVDPATDTVFVRFPTVRQGENSGRNIRTAHYSGDARGTLQSDHSYSLHLSVLISAMVTWWRSGIATSRGTGLALSGIAGYPNAHRRQRCVGAIPCPVQPCS